MAEPPEPRDLVLVEGEALPPEPEATGVTAVQRDAIPIDSDALIGAAGRGASTGGIGVLSIAAVIEQLRHGVTGTAARLLLQVSTARMEADLQETREERDTERQTAAEWKTKWHEEDKAGAVLKTKLAIATEVQIVSNILTTAGGIAVGLGTTNVPLAIVGALLLLIGWIWPFVSRKRK